MLGNLFYEALPFVCAGRSFKERVANLWTKIKEYYTTSGLENQCRLQGLTPEMIKRDKKAPKFRGKGAETRHLVAFAVELAQEYNEKVNTSHSLVVYKMVSALFDVYMAMSLAAFDASAVGTATRKFLVLYESLTKEAQKKGHSLAWRMKPKFHLVQEMGEFQVQELGNPRLFWCYRDESFVGFIATIVSSRGGGGTASTNPLTAMEKYRALCCISSL